MGQKLGLITIAHAPRDDVTPDIRRRLPPGIEIVERGNLDGLGPDEVERLAPDGSQGDTILAARLGEGTQALLSQRKIMHRMQRLTDELVDQDGVAAVVVLCGADWSELRSPVPIVNPGRLFPALLRGLLPPGAQIGLLLPSEAQFDSECRMFRQLGFNPVPAAASPYGDTPLDLARSAAEKMRGCDFVWMSCIGMDEAMRAVVARHTGRPVILARSVLAAAVMLMLPEEGAPASACRPQDRDAHLAFPR